MRLFQVSMILLTLAAAVALPHMQLNPSMGGGAALAPFPITAPVSQAASAASASRAPGNWPPVPPNKQPDLTSAALHTPAASTGRASGAFEPGPIFHPPLASAVLNVPALLHP